MNLHSAKSFINDTSSLINKRSIIMYLVALAPLSYVVYEIYRYDGNAVQADKILIDFVIGIIWVLLVIVLEIAFSFKEINDKLDKKNSIIEILKTSDLYFSNLKSKINYAKTDLRLMNLDEHPPTKEYYSDYEVREGYFKSLIPFAKAHPNVKIRRIMSIPNRKKAEWIRSEMEEAKKYTYYQFGYVKTDLKKPKFFKSVTGCNIIDEDKIFLFNPITDTETRLFEECLYIENREIAKVYSLYFDRLWAEIEKDNPQIGCLLSGNVPGEDKLMEIERRLPK